MVVESCRDSGLRSGFFFSMKKICNCFQPAISLLYLLICFSSFRVSSSAFGRLG